MNGESSDGDSGEATADMSYRSVSDLANGSAKLRIKNSRPQISLKIF